MIDTLLLSNALLWMASVALSVVIFALIRQVGVLHERIAPAGALALSQGAQPGEPLPTLVAPGLDGSVVQFGGPSATGKSTLLFFLSTSCRVCRSLLPALKSSRHDERRWLDIVLASDGDLEAQREFSRANDLDDFTYVVSKDLGMSLQIGKLPYVVLADETGIVRAQGLVNSREHLDSVFEAKDLGFSSLQEYLQQTDLKVAETD